MTDDTQTEHDEVHRDLGPDMDNLFATRNVFSGNEIDLENHFNSKDTKTTRGRL